MADTPRIYVACLGAYNGGRLHGEWIDADQSADDIHEAIKQMLSRSPEPGAEEWAIHDHDNFQGISISESQSVATVVEIAELLREHDTAGAVAYNYFNDLDDARKALADNYYGEWSSLADWAEEYLSDTGGLENVPESLRAYIDFERWAKDMEMGGDIFSVEVDGKLHIFSNH
jgi:antirestriction protein